MSPVIAGWLIGLLLSVVSIAIIVTQMNRNLRWKNLDINLRSRPGFLILLAGFAVFPILNFIVGGLVLVYLLLNPINWKE